MTKKNEKKGVFFNRESVGTKRVDIYVLEKGFACEIYSSEYKILKRLNVDDFEFICGAFVYRIAEEWFAVVTDKDEELYLGSRFENGLFVFDGADGKKHYHLFHPEGDYIFGEAEKIETFTDIDDCVFLFVSEGKSVFRIFIRYGGFWREEFSDDMYYFLIGDGNFVYCFFYEEDSERFILLNKGVDFSTFSNVVIEKSGDVYTVYIYKGKDLVVATEGTSWRETDEGMYLDDKFWKAEKGSNCVDCTPLSVSEQKADEEAISETVPGCGQNECRLPSDEFEAADEPEDDEDAVVSDEVNGKKSLWSRLGLWLGWWK